MIGIHGATHGDLYPLRIAAIPGAILLFAVLSYRGEKRAEQLRAAIRADNIPAVRELVTRWPSLLRPRTRGIHAGSPLHAAAWDRRYDVVEALLELGADVNACDDMLEAPLHKAVSKPFHAQHAERTSEIAELLIASGASVHAKSESGRTPLHSATSGDVAKVLLRHGADPNATTTHNGGRSPMHIAAGELCIDVVESLAQHGGDINLRDNDGYVPLQYAAHFSLPSWDPDSFSMIETMIQLGADPSLLDYESLDQQIEFWRRKGMETDRRAVEHLNSLITRSKN